MKNIYLLFLLAILAGCGKQDPNKQLLKEVAEAYKSGQEKVLTEKLTNEDTEFITDTMELRERCDRIMSFIGKGDVNGAFDEMKKYTFLPEKEMDSACSSTRKQLDLTENRHGKFSGFEFISQKNISPSLVKFIYIAKRENHPLAWRFVFYKADDKWTLNVFNWDDQIQTLE